MTFSKRFILTLLAFFIIFLGAVLLFIDINKPFWGHHDWNSVVYSNVARNYLKYGLLNTKLGQVTNVDMVDADSYGYISHYPPLLPILMSVLFNLIGESETSARLTIVFFSIILIFSLYLIGKELKSELFGIFTASISIFYPIFIYFGKLPVHDTVVPALSALGFWLYLKYLQVKEAKYYFLLVAILVVSALVNWSAFYFAVALGFHQVITSYPKSVRVNIFMLVPISMFLFALHLLHLEILGVKTGGAFSNVLIRMNPYLTADLYGFSLFKYIRGELLLLKIYYTMPVFAGSVLFIVWSVFAFIKVKLTSVDKFLLSLLVYGSIQLLVFSQLSFIHDYMIYYLFPFMSISTAYVIFKIFGKLKKSAMFASLLIVVLYLVSTNQHTFTHELLETSMHKRGVDAALVIKNWTSSGEIALITSNSFKDFEEVFVRYYADRNVQYGEVLPENYESIYRLIIRPKVHDTLPSAQKLELDESFERFEDENFIWYRLE